MLPLQCPKARPQSGASSRSSNPQPSGWGKRQKDANAAQALRIKAQLYRALPQEMPTDSSAPKRQRLDWDPDDNLLSGLVGDETH